MQKMGKGGKRMEKSFRKNIGNKKKNKKKIGKKSALEKNTKKKIGKKITQNKKPRFARTRVVKKSVKRDGCLLLKRKIIFLCAALVCRWLRYISCVPSLDPPRYKVGIILFVPLIAL